MYSIILSVETTLAWLRFVHGMSHLEASTDIGAFILVILLAPARFRSRTATTSARFGHGCCGINVASKEKHCSMGNVDFVELKLLNCGGIIALWNLSLIEENILDRVRNLNSLAANRCVDVECGEGRYRLFLDSWLHLGLGRCRCLDSRTDWTTAWHECRCS